MKTPKKRVTLKTPKRSTRTPFKSTDKEKKPANIKHKNTQEEEEENEAQGYSIKFINDIDIELKNTEKDLIDSLQKENDFLRSTNLYIKFLGLDISQVGNKYVVKYNVDKEKRHLHFELVPEDDMFVYQLVRSENLDELGILGDEISFEKEQIAKFFYKVMEIMISD
jgi:hypothetical protein